jgi:hypothetical protein
LFSQKEFIEASRSFVCVRLESYENEEHQKMVRSFLDGRFENTALRRGCVRGVVIVGQTGEGEPGMMEWSRP